MAQQDLISVKIPEADLAEVKAAIAVLKAKLLPHLKVLTVQERSDIPKMGDKTVAFVRKALDYAQLYQNLVPTFLDLEAMETDVAAVGSLWLLSRDFISVSQAVEDSIMLSGSEAYQAALVFYASVKSAAKLGVPGAQAVYDDLSARFPGRGPAKKV